MSFEIEIFNAATHGRDYLNSEADLDQAVANFQPELAPLKIGHAQQGEESHGWVTGLRREGSRLFAKLSDLSEELLEKLKARRLRNRSAEFRNYKDKGWTLTGLAFLGKSLPACKGMAPLAFSHVAPAGGEPETIFIYSEGHGVPPAAFSEPHPDEEVPEMDPKELKAFQERIAALESDKKDLQAKLSEAEGKLEDQAKFVEISQERDALKADNAAKDQEIAAFKEREAQHRKDKRLADRKAAFKELGQKGIVLPAEENSITEYVDKLDAEGEKAFWDMKAKETPKVKFGEDTHKDPPANGEASFDDRCDKRAQEIQAEFTKRGESIEYAEALKQASRELSAA